jgi:hypothetical protein
VEILNFTQFKLKRSEIDLALNMARRCRTSGYRDCPGS